MRYDFGPRAALGQRASLGASSQPQRHPRSPRTLPNPTKRMESGRAVSACRSDSLPNMRWQPDSAVCAECGFDWAVTRPAATAEVIQAPDAAEESLRHIKDPTLRIGELWSASMYVFHLVDLLHISSERLLTLIHDPGRGITGFDENALAEARRYHQLSTAAGLISLRIAARDWAETESNAPAEATVNHVELGEMGALEIIRRTAHEVHHHVMDIDRYREP